MQRTRRLIGFIDHLYWGSGIAADVPAMAYFLMISLAPFVLGVAAVAARVADTDRLITKITVRASEPLPHQLQDSLVQIIDHAQRSSGVLLGLAILGCLWTCSGAVGVLVRCQHRILQRQTYHPIAGRLREMGLAGLVLILVVALAGLGATASGLVGRLSLPLLPSEVGLLAWGLTLAVLTLLYALGPRGRMHLRPALWGALPASMLLQMIPLILAQYAHRVVGVANVAQLFLVLVVLVLGCTLAAQIILLGALLGCTRQRGIKLRQLGRFSLVESGDLD